MTITNWTQTRADFPRSLNGDECDVPGAASQDPYRFLFINSLYTFYNTTRERPYSIYIEQYNVRYDWVKRRDRHSELDRSVQRKRKALDEE